MAMKLLPCSDHGNTFTDRPRKAGERSDGFQIDCGRLAVLPLLELVGDLLVLVEIAEAGAFHRRDVHEYVLGLVVRLNEAETLARVEPFHGTGRHGVLSMDSRPAPECAGHQIGRGRNQNRRTPEGMPRTDPGGIRCRQYGACGAHWQGEGETTRRIERRK